MEHRLLSFIHNYQLSTINYQLSTINYQLSTATFSFLLFTEKILRKDSNTLLGENLQSDTSESGI